MSLCSAPFTLPQPRQRFSAASLWASGCLPGVAVTHLIKTHETNPLPAESLAQQAAFHSQGCSWAGTRTAKGDCPARRSSLGHERLCSADVPPNHPRSEGADTILHVGKPSWRWSCAKPEPLAAGKCCPCWGSLQRLGERGAPPGVFSFPGGWLCSRLCLLPVPRACCSALQ